MRFWKKVKRLFFGPWTEIGFVEASLRRYEYKLYEINESFNPANDCCQDCMTGGYYSKLLEKIERIQKQLDRLKAKKGLR
jgi:hypothetical protein